MSWHVIEIIQVRNDDNMDKVGSTASNGMWSDLGNILKIELIPITDGLAVRHGKESGLRDDA